VKPVGGCVDPDELVAFASGRLTGDALERVESHLDGCDACRTAMAAAARLDTGLTATSPSPGLRSGGELEVLPAGTAVGRYEVVAVAGAGGMGVIYRAIDPTLHRTVALKLVRSDRVGAGAAEQLLFEAKAMARIVHPEVLPVYDAGTFGAQLFIAMEWVEGTTLRRALEAKPLPWRETVALFIRAGRGLAAAHRAGLVHRDFKPENVLVGDDGRLRVSDFGLAHDVAQAEVPAGTVGYLAPEVLRGAPATAASDQFAFCVALRDALRDAGPASLERCVQRGLEPSPGSRHASMDALVSELERIAKPGRIGLAASAAAALALAAGVWVAARGPSDAEACSRGAVRLDAVWGAHRKAALLAAAPDADRARAARIAGVLDVFAARWSESYRQACDATHGKKEQSEQLLDLRLACLNQKLAGVNGLVHELEAAPQSAFAKGVEAAQEAVTLGRCSDAGWLTASGGAKLTPSERTRVSLLREQLAAARQTLLIGKLPEGSARAQALAGSARELGVKAVEGEALLLVAEFQRKLRTKESEGSALDRAIDDVVLAGTEAQYPQLLGEAWLLRMRACTDDARFAEAERAEQNLAANLRAIGSDPWLQARHDVSLGTLRMRQSKPDEALAAFASARKSLAVLPEAEARLLVGDVHGSEALVLLMLGEIARGVKSLELAIAANEDRFGPDHAKLADQRHNLAEALLVRGELDAAQKSVDEAGRVWALVYGAENPRVAVNLTLSAQVLAAQGRWSEALAAVTEAKRVFALHHLEGQFVFMRALCAEGEVRLGEGDAGAAEKALREGLALAPSAAGKYPLDEAACHRALGEVLARAGKTAGAREALERAVQLYRDAKAAGPWLARAQVGLAELDVREGQAARAVPVLESAIALLEQQQLDPPTLARARVTLDLAKH